MKTALIILAVLFPFSPNARAGDQEFLRRNDTAAGIAGGAAGCFVGGTLGAFTAADVHRHAGIGALEGCAIGGAIVGGGLFLITSPGDDQTPSETQLSNPDNEE